jgi:FkbM family methyltransferase
MRFGLTAIAFVVLFWLPACHRGAPDDILVHGTKLYSQHDEELIIRHFFDDERNGVFLDVGCWDWKDGSTTLYLEEKLGWSGIGADAQPKVREGYEQHRPHTKFQNYIVTDRSGMTGKLYVGGQVSSIDEKHVEQFGAQWDQTDPIEVPTITINDLLAQNRIEHVDFVSMDIEGAEPRALAGFDINKYKPRLVLIESSPEIREAILQYFTTHGYERIDEYLPYDSVNWYFRPVGTKSAGNR